MSKESCRLCSIWIDQLADQREEIYALRSLLEQACRAYVNEYGEELSREALDSILTIIAPKRLGLGTQDD